MLLPDQLKHEYRNVIVNKPALQAWLHAWTTGASFSPPASPVPSFRKEETLAFATLRRLRSKMAK
jgi:hypothetical protein